jgi:hypothetical protein
MNKATSDFGRATGLTRSVNPEAFLLKILLTGSNFDIQHIFSRG